ncbi:Glycosyl transferase, group 2 family protein [Rhodovulum sp. PH10]|nr:Glycosyl transferase, group 2 family protein [Rhodovulum sp. PH10]
MIRRRIDLVKAARAPVPSENEGADGSDGTVSPSDRRREIALDLHEAGIHGWYRIKIVAGHENIERVALDAIDQAGKALGSLRTLVWREGFRGYVHLGRAVARLSIRVEFADPRTAPLTATLRPLSAAEILWQAVRQGRLRHALPWVVSMLRPHRPFAFFRSFPTPSDADYDRWIEIREPALTTAALADLRVIAAARPTIAVLLPVRDPPPHLLAAAIDSVKRQTTGGWQLCIGDDASADPEVRQILDDARSMANVRVVSFDRRAGPAAATAAAFALADAPFAGWLGATDRLARSAIEVVSGTLAQAPETALLYTDEDRIDRQERRGTPYFKPDFSRDLLYSYNYFNHFTVCRSHVVHRAGGWDAAFDGAHDYDLVLRILERLDDPGRIAHLPLVLYHWRIGCGAAGEDPDDGLRLEAGRRALAGHLARTGVRAEVSVVPGAGYRVRYVLPDPPPRVSIVIPFRNRADLLRNCITSIRERTRYDDYELLLLDNDSTDPQTRALLASYASDPRIRIVPVPGPFNYSAVNNRGAALATGEYLCFLNNDTEVISPDWLADMVGYASQVGVGCVGAKLYYDDDTVQHAGVVMGVGRFSNHVFLHQPRTASGYFGRLRVASNYSALTGACLLMRRAVFDEVGGFDAEALPVAYNDIDLCLRVQAKGYRNVFTPFAELYHLESASRGRENSVDEIDRWARETDAMLLRHRMVFEHDPCYSPHLTRKTTDFSIAVDECA